MATGKVNVGGGGLKPSELADLVELANQADLSNTVAAANIVSKLGSPTVTGDTWSKIGADILTQKTNMATNLTLKGIASAATESLKVLVDKFINIITTDATAIAENILSSKTAYVNNIKVTGTMTNNLAETKATYGKTLLNIIPNGNFVDTIGWAMDPSGSISATSNILTTLATTQYGGPKYLIPNYLSYAGHKLYVKAHVKATVPLVLTLLNDTINQPTTANTGSNTYEFTSGMLTVTASPTALYFKVQDQRASGWDNVYVKQVVVIDLTTAFGAGLEPTQTQMDNIINAMGGWFGGNLILSKITNGAYINNGILGTPEVLFNDPNKIATNIVSGITIDGITGTVKKFSGVGTTDASGKAIVTGLPFQPKLVQVIINNWAQCFYIDAQYNSAVSFPSQSTNSYVSSISTNGFVCGTIGVSCANLPFVYNVSA